MRAISPSPLKRPVARTAVTLGAAGLAALLGGVWLFRAPLAEHVLTRALGERGTPARLSVTQIGLGGVKLSAVSIGADANTAGLSADRAEAILAWSLAGPRVSAIYVDRPVLHARFGAQGLDIGGLETLLAGRGASTTPARLPRLSITINEGRLEVATPAGPLTASVSAAGTLGQDFAAALAFKPAALAHGSHRLSLREASLNATTEAGGLRLTGSFQAPLAAGPDWAGQDLTGTINGAVPAAISGAAAEFAFKTGAMNAGGVAAKRGQGRIDFTFKPAGQDGPAWRAQGEAKGEDLTGPAPAGAASVNFTLSQAQAAPAAGTFSLLVSALRHPALSAGEAELAGPFRLRPADGENAGGVSAQALLRLDRAMLTPQSRAALVEAVPSLSGLPLAPLGESLRAGLESAARDFSINGPATLEWGAGAGRITLPGPMDLSARSGALITISALEPGRPAFSLDWPSGAIASLFKGQVTGGGLPPLQIAQGELRRGAGVMAAKLAFNAPDWRMPGARVSIAPSVFEIEAKDAISKWTLSTNLAGDSSGGGVDLRGLNAPLNLVGISNAAGLRVSGREPCMSVTWRAIEAVGLRLEPNTLPICGGAEETLFGRRPDGRFFGGFKSGQLSLAGKRTADNAPVTLRAGAITGGAMNSGDGIGFGFAVADPRIDVQMAPDRLFSFAAADISGATRPREAGAGMAGVFAQATMIDPAIPTTITNIAGRWSAAPENGQTVIRVRDGAARVEDTPPPELNGTAGRARFNPLHLAGVEAALVDGVFSGRGDIFLADDGRPERRRLAGFTANHILAAGAGAAKISAEPLVFSDQLDLYEVTELARGVVDLVEGPVKADLRANWDSAGLRTGGEITLDKINLSSRSLGPIKGISGTMWFDDLLALTTLPGQQLSIAQLNPGVKIENGVITFQILGPSRLRMEAARWPFADGELAIEPQDIEIGADPFKMRLVLRNVDAGQLLRNLELQDLTATGRIGGNFDLRFEREAGGFIERSALQAEPGGGRISYTGDLGEGMTGISKVGFDALKSFAYDNLIIEISGPLDGDIISAIRFDGENIQPVNGADLAGQGLSFLPGVDRVKVTGVPFKYRVSVVAPFRDLEEGYKKTQDARPLVEEALRQAEQQQQDNKTPVDQQDAPPR